MPDKNYSTKLKELYTPDIIDEVISFANADGGVIYIGICEDSTVTGISDPAGVAARAAQDIVSSIQPDISSVVQVRTVQLKGKDLVAVMVGKGTDKPYSRIGTQEAPQEAAPAHSPAQLPDTAGSFNEAAPCTAGLSFSSLKLIMEACELSSDSETLRLLNIYDNDGRYTNLALLLSEQCPYNIKVTQYEDADRAAIKYSCTINGSLLRQYAEACRLTEKLANGCYPTEAVSEAILNALVHRNYSYSGSTIISIFTDRMEIVSLGSLPQGISMNAIAMGISQPRYPRLADALTRLELMDCCGSGIGRIKGLYAKYGKAPLFEAADGAFRVTLPNIHTTGKQRSAPDGYKALVLERAKEKGFVVRSDVEELAGLKTTAAYNLIKEMVAEELLIASGVGKKTIYKLP